MLKSVQSRSCSPAGGADPCAPSRCRARCALEVLDGLLSDAGAISGEEADGLLDLRQLLAARREAEEALRLFCDLRRRMEHRHYLAFYRLRRWFETQAVAVVQNRAGGPPALLPLRLQFYCVEAVRRGLLCAAARHGMQWDIPRLSFAFVPLPEHSVRERAPVQNTGC